MNSIFNDREFDLITKKINKLSDLLNNQSDTQINSLDTDDLTNDLISAFNSGNSSKDNQDANVNSLFNMVSVPQDRLNRYNIYEEMYNSVPLIKRMITVYISNIMSKNPITSKSFIYKKNNEHLDTDVHINGLIKISKHICEKFGLEDKLKNVILPNKLTYGDYFVEVVDVNKHIQNKKIKQNIHSNSVMMESDVRLINEITFESFNNKQDYYISKMATHLFEFEDLFDELTLITEVTNKSNNDDNENENDTNNINSIIKNINLQNVLLKYHKPHNIIILNTKYGTCLGYLEIIESKNSYSNFNSMSNAVTNISNSSNMDSNLLTTKLIQFMLNKIISDKLQIKNKNIADTLDEETYNIIKRFIVENNFENQHKQQYKSTNVRFIPLSDMVHFKNHGSVEYAPFSRSVVDPLVFTGKLYMLAQLANSISKLSRASVIRKWKIDTGTSRMTGQMVNRLKRELYNTRVTIKDMGSFKSMSNILSDFKDLFVVSQQGRTPVDVDLTTMGDASIKVDDLKDLRQELISLSGIPAVYLGYQDSVELREQLMHVNVSFATDIIDMQENDIKSINQLTSKICNIVDPNISLIKYVEVSLLPPVVLIVQLIESTLNSIGNINSIFDNMSIPMDPYYFLDQYVPQINWSKFKDSAKSFIAKSKLEQSINSDEDSDGGGNKW